MHEAIARALDDLPEWAHAPEVAFSSYGERGVIDILAFHARSQSLLVIELKTEVANVEDLLAVMSRRTRLAKTIASGLEWDASTVSAWVVIAESNASRRRVAGSGRRSDRHLRATAARSEHGFGDRAARYRPFLSGRMTSAVAQRSECPPSAASVVREPREICWRLPLWRAFAHVQGPGCSVVLPGAA